MTQNFLFISGWGYDNTPLKNLANALEQGNAPVYSLPDLEPDGTSVHNENYATVLSRHLQSLNQPVILVGWSTGGIIALETAGEYPEKVAGLILISSTPRFCSTQDFPWGASENELEKMKEGLDHDLNRTLRGFFRRAAYPEKLPPDIRQRRVQAAAQQGKDSLKGGLTYLQEADCRKKMTAIKCPVLLLHGENDRIIPVQAAEWLSAQLHDTSFHSLPDAGHDLIQQREAAVVNTISSYFY